MSGLLWPNWNGWLLVAALALALVWQALARWLGASPGLAAAGLDTSDEIRPWTQTLRGWFSALLIELTIFTGWLITEVQLVTFLTQFSKARDIVRGLLNPEMTVLHQGVILLVQTTDGQGQALPLQDGPTVPEWGGVGDPEQGYYAGHPGKIFAKVLEELWTEVSPTGAYWNPTRVAKDNRLAAFASDSSAYTFAAPDEGTVTVEVTLLFRRAFIELMDQKGWDAPDIIMAQQSLVVTSGK